MANHEGFNHGIPHNLSSRLGDFNRSLDDLDQSRRNIEFEHKKAAEKIGPAPTPEERIVLEKKHLGEVTMRHEGAEVTHIHPKSTVEQPEDSNIAAA